MTGTHIPAGAGSRPDLPSPDLQSKGLSRGSLGLFGSVVLGVSSVAPVYALTATLGPTVSEVGLQMPAVFLVGFVVVFLAGFHLDKLSFATDLFSIAPAVIVGRRFV